MEPIIVIVAAIVLTVGGVLAGRAWAAGNSQRDYRLTRSGYATSVVFFAAWIAGGILAYPWLQNVAIVGAVASAAMAATASQRLVRNGRRLRGSVE